MKILYISILYSPYLYGGVERTLQTLAEGMAQRGHEVTVLTTGPKPGLHEERVGGVRVLRSGVRNLYWQAVREKPSSWKRLIWHLVDIYNPFMQQVVAEVVRREKPDVVSLHNLPGFSVSAWGAIRRAGVPMVHVLHDQYLLCPRCTMFRDDRICESRCLPCRSMRLLHPRLSDGVDAVVGVSRFILDHHLKQGYFRGVGVKSVIHNVRNNQQALKVARRRPDGDLRVGYIGTLDPAKGIELLLKAFQASAKKNWQLHVAGSGPAGYERYLKDSYGAANTFFHGVQKPEKFYPEIDVLVVPSMCHDTLPGVVFEGLSYGVPLIGARRGGIPEMIEHGVNGLLFDPERPRELEEAMTRMAEEVEFRDSASRAARKAAPYYLDMGRFLSSYEKLYHTLAKRKPC